MIFDEKITDSPTLKFAEVARKMNKKGIPIISLGLGEPDFETPEHIKSATIKALQDGYGRYSSVPGIYGLRQKICDKLKNENNIVTAPENIIVTPGAKQAIVLSLMAILKPFDEVINLTPSYVSYVPDIKIAEPSAVIKNIPLRKKDYGLDFERISSAITSKTKVIMINTPHNPTGRMLSREELNFIRKIAIENKIFVISDEIYELLNFSKKKHYSIAAFDGMKELTVTVNGFSKAFAMTGWRIGYAVLPDSLCNKVLKLQQHINTNTCTFIQYGALAALSGSAEHIVDYNTKLRNSAEILESHLGKTNRIFFVKPEGGFFAFLDISSSGLKSNDFSIKLLEKYHVATTPGIAFGEEWDGFIRISMATNTRDFQNGVNYIVKFLEEL